MPIKNGCKPCPLDTRDFSYHGTFGTAKQTVLPDDFSADVGLGMPDQNTTGYPYSCTGHAQTDNMSDIHNRVFDPVHTYKQTCFIEGHPMDRGCDIRNSMKAVRLYGVVPEGGTEEKIPVIRGGQYFNIYDDGGYDWFDDIRNAVYTHKRGVSCGTPWYDIWSYSNNGIMSIPSLDELKNPRLWHNWSCKGWKMIQGEPYLLVKPWTGLNTGDKGWFYMSREAANEVFELRGSVAYIQAEADPSDVRSLQLGLIELALVYISRMLGLIRYN